MAEDAKKIVDNNPNTKYAVPLSIKPIDNGGTDFVLLSIGKEMLEYCPLKDKENKPARKSLDGTLPGIPVQDLNKKNIVTDNVKLTH